jgi:hypothetical protein
MIKRTADLVNDKIEGIATFEMSLMKWYAYRLYFEAQL